MIDKIYYWYNKNKSKLFINHSPPNSDFQYSSIAKNDFFPWLKNSKINYKFLNKKNIQILMNIFVNKLEIPHPIEIANSTIFNIHFRIQNHLQESQRIIDHYHEWEVFDYVKNLCEELAQTDFEEYEINSRTWFLEPLQSLNFQIVGPIVNLFDEHIDTPTLDELPIHPSEWSIHHVGKNLWIFKNTEPVFLSWSNNFLRAIPLSYRDTQNTHLFALCPKVHNIEQLHAWCQNPTNHHRYNLESRQIYELAENTGRLILIRKGKRPIAPKDEILVFNPQINFNPKSQTSSKEAVNLKNHIFFQELNTNDWIATLNTAKEGLNGIDLEGKEIVVRKANRAKDFITGDFKMIRDEDGTTHYFAQSDCIIHKTPSGIHISPHLTIEENVGPNTGNIKFKNNIIIKGAVQTGYSVESGGSITLFQTPEPGAIIRSQGDIICKQGFIGQQTIIESHGTISCNFVEDCKLLAHRNIIVNSYCLNSKLYAREYAVILGNRFSKADSGAIMGGIVNGAKGIWMHSISSEIGFALAVTGLSIELEEKIVDIQNRDDLLGNKIAELNVEYKRLLNQRNTTEISSKDQLLMDRLLEHMASLSKLKIDLKNKINDIYRQSEQYHSSECEIFVAHKIYPNCEFQIEGIRLQFHHERKPVTTVVYRSYRNFLIEFPEPDSQPPITPTH